MTKTLLRIDASARNAASVTRALANEVVTRLAPEQSVIRDLNTSIPHVDEAWIGANFTPADQRSPEQLEKLALSDALIAELKAADTVLIATPIYNFGVPAALKSWFDQVARVGVTFRYTENGPVGLLEGKRAILVIASGGTQVDSPIDFASPWLRHAMKFIGITDIHTVRSDQQMVDAQASQDRAAKDIGALVA